MQKKGTIITIVATVVIGVMVVAVAGGEARECRGGRVTEVVIGGCRRVDADEIVAHDIVICDEGEALKIDQRVQSAAQQHLQRLHHTGAAGAVFRRLRALDLPGLNRRHGGSALPAGGAIVVIHNSHTPFPRSIYAPKGHLLRKKLCCHFPDR